MNRIEDEGYTLNVTNSPQGCLKMSTRSAIARSAVPQAQAIAIIDGIKNRAIQGQYQVERFTFN